MRPADGQSVVGPVFGQNVLTCRLVTTLATAMVRHFFVFEFAVEIIAFFLTFIYILPIFLQMLIDLPVHVPEPAPTT